MKNEEMLKLLGELDDRFVDEAGAQNAEAIVTSQQLIHKRRHKKRTFTILCAVFIIMVAMLWLFIPLRKSPGRLLLFRNSEYYDLMRDINRMTFERPEYDNNFEMILYGLENGFFEKQEENAAKAVKRDTIQLDHPNYEEVTDNQVDGVIEADIIKRSDKYAYYINGGTVFVYDIAGENSSLVGTYKFKQSKSMYYSYKLLLSEDCNTLTVITAITNKKNHCRETMLTSLDVSDPKSIKKITSVQLSGSYVTSRKIGNVITVVTDFYISEAPNFFNKKEYIPFYKAKGSFTKYVPMEDVTMLPESRYPSYTVIYSLGEEELELIDAKAYFSYVEDIYATKNSFYIGRNYSEYKIEDGKRQQYYYTEVLKLNCNGGALELQGSFTVRGRFDDQYSFDEYNGVLRLVTEVCQPHTNASLYCIDAETLTVISSYERFAPDGESVQSVRFDGDKAYVCTSIKRTDPVFFLDLSDVYNITCKSTGEIPGYSTSLVDIGDGYLLGIGVGEDRNTLKLEIYKQTEDKVISVCNYTEENCSFNYEYKSFYIDRKNGLLGFGVYHYGQTSRYVVLQFDKEREALNVCMDEVFFMESPYETRGFYKDGYYYAFSEIGQKFMVKKINIK